MLTIPAVRRDAAAVHRLPVAVAAAVAVAVAVAVAEAVAVAAAVAVAKTVRHRKVLRLLGQSTKSHAHHADQTCTGTKRV